MEGAEWKIVLGRNVNVKSGVKKVEGEGQRWSDRETERDGRFIVSAHKPE